MGYVGLSNHLDSDTASDLAYVMQDKMADVLKKGLKERDSWCNTGGIINVAMIFEDLIVPCKKFYCWNEKLQKLAEETYKLLNEKIKNQNSKDWGEDKANYKMHINAYKRMLKALDKYLAEAA